MKKSLFGFLSLATFAGILSLVIQSCSTEVASKNTKVAPIKIDGSSTVYPISKAISAGFEKSQSAKKVEVAFSGTTGGFKKFCAGEIDINGASRPINQVEMQACSNAGVHYFELPIAYDALTIAVNRENDWAKDITLEELNKIWEPTAEGKITSWKQVRSTYPDLPLKLFGAGKDSGTFDYFTAAVVGKAGDSRKDYVASEDDLSLVRGIIQEKGALGYFGLVYYEDNAKQLKALSVDSGKGAVPPSRDAVEKAKYQPLARPLFIYVSYKALERSEVSDFVDFYLKNALFNVDKVGYIPLPIKAYQLAQARIANGKVGTIFAGKTELNLTISELMGRELSY